MISIINIFKNDNNDDNLNNNNDQWNNIDNSSANE